MHRVVLAAAAIALTVASCNWSQGWHWPRLIDNGSTTTETRVYFVADTTELATYQRDYVTWAAHVWARSPALAAVPVTAENCPIGRNCIRFITEDLTYPTVGVTTISFDSARHVRTATVRLDPNVGFTMTATASREAVCVESMLGLGGGWDNPATPFNEHSLSCRGDGYPTDHDYAELARVYTNHAGG